MRKKLQQYFLFFLMYSVIGWLYEVFLEVVVYQWGYSDRGVLFGPYCPIYGVGTLVFLFCLGRLLHAKSTGWFRIAKPILLFLGCALIATAIELAASYALEALTGSWPWQTYVDYKFNFEGRIALSPSVRFGLGGMFFLYIVQPLFEKLVGKLSDRSLSRIAGILILIFAIDAAATCIFTFLI
ncbi:MAG: putative ABC transporter permease [Butyricicoccus sp.]|nr:putative ABC transporter permease [Butyricicoccus sp.]